MCCNCCDCGDRNHTKGLTDAIARNPVCGGKVRGTFSSNFCFVFENTKMFKIWVFSCFFDECDSVPCVFRGILGGKKNSAATDTYIFLNNDNNNVDEYDQWCCTFFEVENKENISITGLSMWLMVQGKGCARKRSGISMDCKGTRLLQRATLYQSCNNKYGPVIKIGSS